MTNQKPERERKSRSRFPISKCAKLRTQSGERKNYFFSGAFTSALTAARRNGIRVPSET